MTRASGSSHGPLLIAAVILFGAITWYVVDGKERFPANTNITDTTKATNDSVNAAENTNSATVQTTTTYRNTEFGFSLVHPATWKVSESASGTGDARIVNISFADDTEGLALVIAAESLKGLFRESFSFRNEQQVVINGVTAIRATGASSKDGAKTDLLEFTKSGKVFLLNGPASLVDTVGGTFRFSK